jgi:hypothetical protein
MLKEEIPRITEKIKSKKYKEKFEKWKEKQREKGQ